MAAHRPCRTSRTINATNQQSGAVWRFSKPYMRDWRVGEVARPRLAVSLAVEASSAFLRFLSPLFIMLDLRVSSAEVPSGTR
jgi:NTE family protein